MSDSEVTSFYSWLSQQTGRYDETGLLATKAVRDKTFPRTGRHLYLFLDYYEHVPELREAVKHAHAEWRTSSRVQLQDGGNTL